MAFTPKPTKRKVDVSYKSLYIKQDLIDKINELAIKHDTSFNNIVISIIEDFFENQEK